MLAESSPLFCDSCSKAWQNVTCRPTGVRPECANATSRVLTDFSRFSKGTFRERLGMSATNAKRYESGIGVWRFANCEFDERRHELRVRGTPVELESKPLEVLHQLLINAGEVVTKDELLTIVWPDVTVVDGSLATAVSKLRKALGSDENVILTVPRLGYRLACAVEGERRVTTAIAPLDLQTGDPVPGREHWRLVHRLDAGAAGQVWLAEHPKTHERRVFKFATDSEQLRSIKREVTLARLLRQELGERPEFVRILEWNFDSAPYFIESEYGGPNLAEWAEMQGGLAAVPLQTKLELVIQMARAVADAHKLGVLHKDIKPANILVTGKNGGWAVQVADFGSGTLLDLSRLGALGITNAGFTRAADDLNILTGTMLYIAPEVLAGQSPNPSSDVYALGVLLYQMLAGEFRKPLSPGWESDIDDPLLRSDIAEAACGDPKRRMPSAAELADRLSNLDTRRLVREREERDRLRAGEASLSRARSRVQLIWAVAIVAVVALASIAFFRIRPSRQPLHGKTVAILPFQNAAGDTALDFLRFGLPDEIATTLNHMHSLAIRPFSDTSQYTGEAIDLRKVGNAVQASTIITGHFLRVGAALQITIEAVDLDHDQLLWQDTVNVPTQNLLALQAQISGIARGKLAGALGASEYVADYYPPPRNEEAYALFLRSQEVRNIDSKENEDAVAMLERSVALDNSYAPAWAALGIRLYGVARFRGGGPRVLQHSDEALEHALAVDPDSVAAANELILHRIERGELAKAYEQALDLLRRRPDRQEPHNLMAYVLRYAGLLSQSAEQCDAAAKVDVAWPSCSTTYMQLGDYAAARSVLRKDLGSEWSRAHGIEIFLRQGKISDALRLDPPKIPGWESYKMLLSCAAHQSPEQIAAMAAGVKPDNDPEVSYLFAGHLAYCGQAATSITMLKQAIAGHYCSYPAIDRDPFFESVRSSPDFAEVRQAAIACQSEFVKALHHPPLDN